MGGATNVLGRDAELELLRRALAEVHAPARCLLVEGPPGIGKTALWEEAVAQAAPRVALIARASEDEAGLAYSAIGDLFEGIDDRVLAPLPSPQRRALEATLLLRDDEPTDPRAVAAAVLAVLRARAAQSSVLVALDDVHCLDTASATALRFAARRLIHEPVLFLATHRSGERPSPLLRAFEPDRLERLQLDPLSSGAIRRLLFERLDTPLPRRTFMRIFETAGGNPLFALELARLAATGAGDVRLPETLEEAVRKRLAKVSKPGRRALLAVALAGAPLPGDVARAAGGGLEDALDAGVVVLDGERLRPAHPLLRPAAIALASARERRTLHLELAEAAADEQVRARHLALGTDRPNADAAAAVATAAAGAVRRGAAELAAELAEHALRLTPSGAGERDERLLFLADRLDVLGRYDRMRTLLEPALDDLPPGPLRGRAHLLLGENALDIGVARDHVLRAIEQSGEDPAIRARAYAHLAIESAVEFVDSIAEADAHAELAVELARSVLEPAVVRRAAVALSWTRVLRGRAADDIGDVPGAAVSRWSSLDRIRALRALWRGELARAREVFVRECAVADEAGEAGSYLVFRLHLCELELRVGGWAEATALLDEWSAESERFFASESALARCRALLAAGRGEAAAADFAADALAAADAANSRWNRLEALRASGLAALLAGEPDAAAAALGDEWESVRAAGVEEPGAFPVAPDLVEALAATGELDQARAVTAALERAAEEQDHPWARAAAAASRGAVAAAEGAYAEAAGELEQAAAAYDRLGLRFDAARAELHLADALRRDRRLRDGRLAAERAVAAFVQLGGDGWVDHARAELTRFGGRRASGNELTPSEKRVARLVAAGRRNREVASELFVTVSTVEATLSRIYAKLGIRSRSELAARLASIEQPEQTVGIPPLSPQAPPL